MSAELAELRFRSDSIFSGETGLVDHDKCIIHGVAVITGGIEAEGHNLQVDDVTLKQLQTCAKSRGKVPVNLDHGTGVKDLNGYLTSFRMDGNKIRADWHLLKTHDETPKMLERSEVMPDCFGMSTAFKGPPEGVPIGGGKMAARCEKLLSVDCVTRPAANAGLFSEKVDTVKKGMAKENKAAEKTGQVQEPVTLETLAAQLQQITSRLDEHENFLINGPQVPSLEELDQMTDEDLNALGVTRDEVNAAIEEALAEAGIENEIAGDVNRGGAAKGGEGEGTGELAGATSGAASGGADGHAAATFKAMERRIIQLERKLAAKDASDKRTAEEKELSEIEGKIVKLAEQRDTAMNEVKELKAKNECLELAVKTGTRPVKPGLHNGERLFSANGKGEMHAFSTRVEAIKKEKNCSEAQAIIFAQKENPALHAEWVTSLRSKTQEVTV